VSLLQGNQKGKGHRQQTQHRRQDKAILRIRNQVRWRGQAADEMQSRKQAIGQKAGSRQLRNRFIKGRIHRQEQTRLGLLTRNNWLWKLGNAQQWNKTLHMGDGLLMCVELFEELEAGVRVINENCW